MEAMSIYLVDRWEPCLYTWKTDGRNVYIPGRQMGAMSIIPGRQMGAMLSASLTCLSSLSMAISWLGSDSRKPFSRSLGPRY